jgi:ElaB/YqjD/DUF883 family membrane-anchored ribosome-binding protein
MINQEELQELKKQIEEISKKIRELTTDSVEGEIALFRENSREQIRRTVDSLRENAKQLNERAKAAQEKSEAYAKKHPWEAVGTALLAGVVVGALAGRISRR